ncbi:DUF4185 domain-containing protein [Rhodococcus sp. IEGM 1366]|uniref:DUF4185 domain-containing protein n=1 Tax=Rhodococcus sp. IEGM 1366 TaxID=3082223 RepID=UPI0029539C18|nr:DUF4185 domain-containing protein [Rhodococcus sp. IEGM 1366]MDV8065167.1 DUF4185 domain-containing protein [Rhodococcus sp. IEGM 1366]
MFRTGRSLGVFTAGAAVASAAVTMVAPTAVAAPGCAGVSGVGSTGGPGNAVPWLNGNTGGLPGLSGRTAAIEKVTGTYSPNNTVERFNVLGTDLGIMWDNGAGQILTAFGDTTGHSRNPICDGLVGEWRSNVLFRSADRVLADGMRFDSGPMDGSGQAREIIAAMKIPGVEASSIPTGGIAVNGVQYLSYMSVRNWGDAGQWSTNYSQIATSSDNGETWATRPETLRPNIGGVLPVGVGPAAGNENFQMNSMVKDGGFVYNYGTPAGRAGEVRLSRVSEGSILDLASYEYWNGNGWIRADPAAAVPVMDGRIGEISVQYNEFLGKFVAMYTDVFSSIVMRTASSPAGPWTAPETLVNLVEVPGIYAAYIHPWSNGSDLYFLATTWADYNVMLMRTTLVR